jgi:hypothetical protein
MNPRREMDMLHGHRVSRQKLGNDRNRPSGRDQTANFGNQLFPRQNGSYPSGNRRKDTQGVEKSPLRKASGQQRGTIYQAQQTVAGGFSDRHGMQTKQDNGLEGRGLPLKRGDSWQ